MADPFDKMLSESVYKAISQPGVLEGEEVKAHKDCTVICIGTVSPPPFRNKSNLQRQKRWLIYVCLYIEGPQFSTRSESILYRSLPTKPPISIINMSTMPEAKLFREAEIAYALIAMSTDYDSWHDINEGVSVEMVIGHMVANGANAKRAVVAVLEELRKEGGEVVVGAERWSGQSRGGVLGLAKGRGERGEAVERLRWLFGDEWVDGA